MNPIIIPSIPIIDRGIATGRGVLGGAMGARVGDEVYTA